ncbi:hypothetical protein EDC04DRAFT_1845803 [Pisolithus marmoratus]|nr:hypothetical protein EDC04DRAFT_1845803 [Pisolithus marmoratus]
MALVELSSLALDNPQLTRQEGDPVGSSIPTHRPSCRGDTTTYAAHSRLEFMEIFMYDRVRASLASPAAALKHAQVSAKYTSAALGTLEYVCGEVAYPVVDGACCHVMLHGMHPVISYIFDAYFSRVTTADMDNDLMTFPWNASSMPRRLYNARQLQTPRRREQA